VTDFTQDRSQSAMNRAAMYRERAINLTLETPRAIGGEKNRARDWRVMYLLSMRFLSWLRRYAAFSPLDSYRSQGCVGVKKGSQTGKSRQSEKRRKLRHTHERNGIRTISRTMNICVCMYDVHMRVYVLSRYTLHSTYMCNICFSLVSSALHQNDRNAGHSTRAHIRESCSRALHDTTPKRYNRRHQIHLRVNSTSPSGDKRQVRAIRTTRRAALRDHRHATRSSLARLRARAHTYTRTYFGVCQVISCARYSFPFADPQSGSRP